ncbi:MAG: acyltransferase, partial [Pseudomonadota bacterium]
FLLAGSLARDGHPGRFLERRFHRLLPGLIVSLILAALVMGPAVSNLPLGTYLKDPGTWRYIAQNAVFGPLWADLPGVFDTNPYPAVAGSIWTLPYEVACYLGLLLAALGGALSSRRSGCAVASALVLTYVGLAISGADAPLHPRLVNLHLLALPFFIGVVIGVWSDTLPRSPLLAAGLMGAAAAAQGTVFAEPTMALALIYVTLVLGLARPGVLGGYNRLGDYSYGTYLYAFPVQGLMMHLAGPISPIQNIALALPVTLCLAALSWHLVERPAMRLTVRRRRTQRTA